MSSYKEDSETFYFGCQWKGLISSMKTEESEEMPCCLECTEVGAVGGAQAVIFSPYVPHGAALQ